MRQGPCKRILSQVKVRKSLRTSHLSPANLIYRSNESPYRDRRQNGSWPNCPSRRAQGRHWSPRLPYKWPRKEFPKTPKYRHWFCLRRSVHPHTPRWEFWRRHTPHLKIPNSQLQEIVKYEPSLRHYPHPLGIFETAHEQAGELLKRLESLTSFLRPPTVNEGGTSCPSARSCLSSRIRLLLLANTATTSKLIYYLSFPNSWWRGWCIGSLTLRVKDGYRRLSYGELPSPLSPHQRCDIYWTMCRVLAP